MAQYVSGPMAEYLAQWPSTGGSAYERLQLTLKRIPAGTAPIFDTVLRELRAA